MSNKIGLGVITCNRRLFFTQLINSVPDVDRIVIVNDGNPYDDKDYPTKISKIIQHKQNLGIAKSKNDALKYLLKQHCNHIFLFEDDIALRNQSIIEEYIRASEASGILHFNYAYHGKWNKKDNGEPNPRLIVKYNDSINLAFHFNLTGALSYFRDTVLLDVGLMDENYINVLEHVDHTYKIIKKGYHPPFNWFADVESSFQSIEELDPTLATSINEKNVLSVKFRARIFGIYFMLKNGHRPFKIPSVEESQVLKNLNEIKDKYAKNGGNLL